MNRTIVLTALTFVFSALVYAGTTVVQAYKCGDCGRVEQYAESGYRTHYCSGTKDKAHSKRIMQHIGEQRIK